MRFSAASAIGSGASLIASIAVPIAFPHLDPWIGRWLLILAAALGALALGLYLARRKGGDGDNGTSQLSTGPNSPNMAGTFNAPVTQNFHAAPPPPAVRYPPRSPYGSAKSAAPPRPIAFGVYPDMTLAEVVSRLLDKQGPVLDSELDEALRKVDLKILDAVVNRSLHTWGRRQPDKPVTLVWSEAWERGNFSSKKDEIAYRSPDNPRSQIKWTNLHFSREEVDEWLPGPSGRNPTTGY